MAELMDNIFTLYQFMSRHRNIALRYTNPALSVVRMSIYMVYVASMFLITADRLCASLLTIQYKSLCTVSRTKIAIVSSWCILHLGTPLIFSIIYAVLGKGVFLQAVEYTHKYLASVLCISFFLFAAVSYIIMFYVFVKSNRRTSSTLQRSVLHLFIHSKFYVAILITSTTLVLMVIPELLFSYFRIKYFQIFSGPNWIRELLNIINNFSDTTDALIYVLCYSPVKNIMRKLLKLLPRYCILPDHNGSLPEESRQAHNIAVV